MDVQRPGPLGHRPLANSAISRPHDLCIPSLNRTRLLAQNRGGSVGPTHKSIALVASNPSFSRVTHTHETPAETSNALSLSLFLSESWEKLFQLSLLHRTSTLLGRVTACPVWPRDSLHSAVCSRKQTKHKKTAKPLIA